MSYGITWECQCERCGKFCSVESPLPEIPTICPFVNDARLIPWISEEWYPGWNHYDDDIIDGQNRKED